MEWGALLLAAVFALLSLACVFAVPVGLPGLWAMLAIAAGIEVIDGGLLGTPGLVTFGWPTLAIGAGIGVAGGAVHAVTILPRARRCLRRPPRSAPAASPTRRERHGRTIA